MNYIIIVIIIIIIYELQDIIIRAEGHRTLQNRTMGQKLNIQRTSIQRS